MKRGVERLGNSILSRDRNGDLQVVRLPLIGPPAPPRHDATRKPMAVRNAGVVLQRRDALPEAAREVCLNLWNKLNGHERHQVVLYYERKAGRG